MCGTSDKLNSKTLAPSTSPPNESALNKTMSDPIETAKTKYSFTQVLELAADNDVEGFQQCLSKDLSMIHEVGLWYGYQRASRKMVVDCRTPLMVAATYGSVDVVKLILSLSKADVNQSCGWDKSTALHCAASGGSKNALDVVKLLLLADADPNGSDANGRRPFDVIVANPDLPNLKVSFEELLKNVDSVCVDDLQNSSVSFRSGSPSLSSSSGDSSLPGVSDFHLSSVTCKEKKEYPIDPTLPDIKNSIYATDEFRMFSFKIQPCSRAYSHDWTECPFAHPGENARRRDPRKIHYSCVPCPDFRKGTCGSGDSCEYAHGIFESWLHPAQYKTRLCKDGTSCTRRVCFFAHTSEELRPLYMSTGSGVPSPRSAAAMDMASALNMLPGSPSAISAISPSPFTSPMSPHNDISRLSMNWPQQSIPTLHLPGNSLQTSRLRSSLSARDVPTEEMLQDFEIREFSRFSQPQLGSSPRLAVSRAVNLANLDKLFHAEVSSPRFSDQFAPASVLSPSHKSAVFNQLPQQQSMLSPIKTSVFSTNGVSSPMMMSPRKLEPISPMGSRVSMLPHSERLNSWELGSNPSRDLKPKHAVGSSVSSWSKWESPNAKVDWSVQVDELNQLRKSYSFGRKREGPDLSWGQPHMKETPSKSKESADSPSSVAPPVEASNLNPQSESGDNLGLWLEQLKFDQIVA